MMVVCKDLSSRTGLLEIAGPNPSHEWLGYCQKGKIKKETRYLEQVSLSAWSNTGFICAIKSH